MIRSRITTNNGRAGEASHDLNATEGITFAADSPTHLVRVVMNGRGGLVVNTSTLIEGKWTPSKSIYFPSAPCAAVPRKPYSVEIHDARKG